MATAAPRLDESTTSTLPQVTYAFASDVGLIREENQDRYSVIEARHFRLFSVADGMGGARGGSLAASLAVESLSTAISSIKHFTAESLTAAIQSANRVIYDRASQEVRYRGMGTTLVALLFAQEQTFILNVGDSRAYLYRSGIIHRLTRDHNVAEDPETAKAAQRTIHPESMQHMLTRSLGPQPTVEPECYVLRSPLEFGDNFVLCSDGLYNLVGDKEIEGILTARSGQEAVEGLIEVAKLRGGRDNITVVLVSIVDEVTEIISRSLEKPSTKAPAEASSLQKQSNRGWGSKPKGRTNNTKVSRSSRKHELHQLLYLIIGLLGFIAGIIVSSSGILTELMAH